MIPSPSQAGLAPEGRPAGVFLLLGPTGTGKTKTVEALAEKARKLIRIGIEAVGFTKSHLPKGPAAYPEAAVIVDTLLAELPKGGK